MEVSALRDHPVRVHRATFRKPNGRQSSFASDAVSEHVVEDYGATSLSLKAHPVSFIREKLSLFHIISIKDLAKGKDGDIVKVAGLVLVRQRPGLRKAFVL